MFGLEMKIGTTYVAVDKTMVKLTERLSNGHYKGVNLADRYEVMYRESGKCCAQDWSKEGRDLLREVSFTDLYPTLDNNPIATGRVN